MKNKILIIALITLSIILISIIVCASVMISLYNDRYGGRVVPMYELKNSRETYVKFKNSIFDDKLSFLGVDFLLKYDHSERSYDVNENRHYYVDEEGKYTISCWSGEYDSIYYKKSLASISSNDMNVAVFEYDKGEIVYDEYVEWLKSVIYELYEIDASEYVLTCKTYCEAFDDVKNKMRNKRIDGFVTVGENGIGEIYNYTFSFTKYINGLKTDESFSVKVLIDGGIISINHNRFSISESMIETEYNEKKIKRSVDIALAMYFASSYDSDCRYLGECEVRDITLKHYNSRRVLECNVYDAEFIFNGEKTESIPLTVHLYFSYY